MYLITITAGVGLDMDNKPINNLSTKLIKLRSFMAKRFGGYTERSTSGGWVNEGHLICESGVQWEIMSEFPDDNAASDAAHNVANKVRSSLNQSAVMYNVRPVMGGFV